MNYNEALEWMYSQIPMYQRQGKAAYKADLSVTEKMDAHMGHPHHSFKTIHVGGTNGKGSVSHMLAAILQAAGYKTGLYTSPHLKDFRERIRVNGKMVEKEFVTGFLTRYQDFFESLKPSFFEMSVGMAFEYFKSARVDVAVIEVGLGGRLDSTNVIDPDLSLITNISLDHTQFLGNTVAEIAREKAGIIKKGRPVVIGEYDPMTGSIFKEKAHEVDAPICFADRDYQVSLVKADTGSSCFDVTRGSELVYKEICTDLLGSYQSRNILSALRAVEILRKRGYRITNENIRWGLAHVTEMTGFMGRWFVLRKKPLVICDTAHNEAGLALNIKELKRLNKDQVHFVLGFVNDKQLDVILQLFPTSARYYFTRADIPRALDEKSLLSLAEGFGLRGESYHDPENALQAAVEQSEENDIIYVGGSTFLVSELI